MTHKIMSRFEAEFIPRIVQRIAALFGQDGLRVASVPADGCGQPCRVRIIGDSVTPIGRFPYPLNLYLTWDLEEIEYLFEPGGEEKFASYLAALPRKLSAWQSARDLDFRGRSQNQSEVLIGGLDFIG